MAGARTAGHTGSDRRQLGWAYRQGVAGGRSRLSAGSAVVGQAMLWQRWPIGWSRAQIDPIFIKKLVVVEKASDRKQEAEEAGRSPRKGF